MLYSSRNWLDRYFPAQKFQDARNITIAWNTFLATSHLDVRCNLASGLFVAAHTHRLATKVQERKSYEYAR